MALTEGTEYVFAARSTYVGVAGVGDACLVGTQKWLMMAPTKVDYITARKVVTSTYSLGDKPIVEGLQDILASEDLTLDGLNEFISVFCENSDEAELIDLDQVARIKVRSGLLSKGIYTNEKEGGLGGWKGYAIKDKAKSETFMKFYMQSTKFV